MFYLCLICDVSGLLMVRQPCDRATPFFSGVIRQSSQPPPTEVPLSKVLHPVPNCSVYREADR